MTGTFLFVLWAGGGTAPPQIALARRLAAAGHRVRVLAPAVLRDRVEAAGLVFEPYRQTPEHDEADPARSLLRDFGHRSPIAGPVATRDHVFVGMAEPVAADVLAVLAREAVDVVASDYMLVGALFAAEKAGVAAAALVHHIYPLPAPGMPPFGNGWSPQPGLRGAVRDRLGAAAFDRVWAKPLVRRLNEGRTRLGLLPLRTVHDLLATADRVLVLTSRSFDFPAELPANVRYVGPQLENPEWTPPWEPPWPADDPRPLVLVSLSTTYQAQEDLLERTIDAVGRLPVRALITSGPVEITNPPPNCHVASFVPHARPSPRRSGGHARRPRHRAVRAGPRTAPRLPADGPGPGGQRGARGLARCRRAAVRPQRSDHDRRGRHAGTRQ